ncbi:hypothetical protein BN6_22190 [Saccharothrix espanaensis DSM 44229]|uniref:Uncharacterized protein n=1 Tax=Saccharothrix espanaensis (strain ATCC 51144 / DSM 44229 / JCM 9112 / NBRC 15066 / NRRL 15764) TaxID=1179773 RepID=K0JQD8_SACES|nr:hypothetical protein BN6_22190 [Saccharothrix espanaensis DSM 44229]
MWVRAPVAEWRDAPAVITTPPFDTSGSCGVPEVDVAATHVRRLHEELARLTAATIEAEAAYLDSATRAHADGQLDRHGLRAAYDQVRSRARDAGLFGHGGAPQHPDDRQDLDGLIGALAIPEDGTWFGHTGFHGLRHAGGYPGTGARVAFVLFGNGGVPVFIGHTSQFYRRAHNLDREGVTWCSWRAESCADRDEFVEARDRFIDRYGKPDSAAQPPPPPVDPRPQHYIVHGRRRGTVYGEPRRSSLRRDDPEDAPPPTGAS